MKKILSAALLSLVLGAGSVYAQSFDDEFSSRPISEERLNAYVENLTSTLDWNNSIYKDISLENASLQNVSGMEMPSTQFTDLYFSLLDNMRYEVGTEDPWGNNLPSGLFEIHNSGSTIRYGVSDGVSNGNFASEIETINMFGGDFDPYDKGAFLSYLDAVKAQGPIDGMYILARESNGTRWGGISYAIQDIDAYISKVRSMPIGDDESRQVLMQLNIDNWAGLQLQYMISTSSDDLSNEYIEPTKDDIYLTVVYKGFPRAEGRLTDYSAADQEMYESALFSAMGFFNNDLAHHIRYYDGAEVASARTENNNPSDADFVLDAQTQEDVEAILNSLSLDPTASAGTSYAAPAARESFPTYTLDSGVQLVDKGNQVQVYVPVESGVQSGILTQRGSTLRSADGFGEMYTAVSALNDGDERALDTTIEMIDNKPYHSFVLDKSSLDQNLSRIAYIGYSSDNGSRGTQNQPDAYKVNTIAISLDQLFD